jgi:hypothetical protein
LALTAAVAAIFATRQTLNDEWLSDSGSLGTHLFMAIALGVLPATTCALATLAYLAVNLVVLRWLLIAIVVLIDVWFSSNFVADDDTRSAIVWNTFLPLYCGQAFALGIVLAILRSYYGLQLVRVTDAALARLRRGATGSTLPRASFLRMTPARFAVACAVIVLINLSGWWFPVAWLSALDKFVGSHPPERIVAVLHGGAVFFGLNGLVLWSLVQRRVPRVLSVVAAIALAMSGAMGWHSLLSPRHGVVQAFGGAIYAVSSAGLICWLRRQGLGLVQNRHLQSSRARGGWPLPRWRFSLRAVFVAALMLSAAFAVRRLLAGTASLGPTVIWNWETMIGVFSAEQAVLTVAVAWSCFAVRGMGARALGLLAIVVFAGALRAFLLSGTSVESFAGANLAAGLAYDVGRVCALAALLTVVRRCYGLRLVRVPKRVVRSSE